MLEYGIPLIRKKTEFPKKRPNLRFCPYTVIYGAEKTRIQTNFKVGIQSKVATRNVISTFVGWCVF